MSAPSGKSLLFGGTVVAVLAIVAGVLLVGGPQRARMERLDGTRSTNLEILRREIVRFHGSHERLPASLEELETLGARTLATTDPQTGERYPYRPTDESTYELCAEFRTEAKPATAARSKFREHAAEATCFEVNVESGAVTVLRRSG